MIKRGIIFFLGLLFFTQAVLAQQKKADSLLAVLSKAKEDTSKVNLLIDLSKEFKNPDSSRIFSTQARDLAEKLNFKRGLALAYKNIGISYYGKGQNPIVLENWNKSLEVYRSMNDSAGIANQLSNIGAVYYNQGDDVNAVTHYIDALAIAEKIKDTNRIATLLNNMGSVYNHKENTKDKAVDHFLRSLPLFEKLNKKTEIGVTTANLGEIYMETGKNDSAIYFFNVSIKSLENTEKLAQALNGLGAVYDSLKNYPLSLAYFKQADSIARKYSNARFQIIAQLGIADLAKKNNQFRESEIALLKAEELAKAAHQNPLLKLIYEKLSVSYEKKKDFKKAFAYQQALTLIKDTLYNIEADQKLGSVVFDYALEKKENEISLYKKDKELAELELNRQKFAKNALIAGLGLVSLIIFILYRDYLNKAKTNKILDSQKAQIQSLLSNILPDEVAEELQRDGAATPRYYESASVLFTDFKSFTALADRMSPQEVVAELNDCFIEFDAITEKYNIEKIKTIGDAYMCAAGIPVPDPNHYHNIIKAGKEIQSYILRRNKERMAEGLPPWEIRIGIHVGPLVAGVVGKKKYAYDIWGSTVNIASRMESNGEPGQINISSATYELIKDEYECTHRGKIYAKNVGDIDMYFLGDKINKSTLIRENVNIPVS